MTKKRRKKRKLKLYTTTRIKLRNFLSNNSYNRVKEEDLYNRNFIFDAFVFVMKNLNLFRRKQPRNRSYALGRMHQPRFSQVRQGKRELHIFKREKCLLSKNISYCLELYGKGRKEF